MQEVRGVPTHRVWRVPLLQGHEEVRGAGAHEAVVHNASVHRGESRPAVKDEQLTEMGTMPALREHFIDY